MIRVNQAYTDDGANEWELTSREHNNIDLNRLRPVLAGTRVNKYMVHKFPTNSTS